MTTSAVVRRVHAVDDAMIGALADVLIDCVDGGASVSFMHPLTRERATAFWRAVADGVAAGQRALLVAEDDQRRVRHGAADASISRRTSRIAPTSRRCWCIAGRGGRGLGAALMKAAEATARDCGKTLLVLDAVTDGDAARLYERLGWMRVGDIPNYALLPQGGFCSTTVFYRRLD